MRFDKYIFSRGLPKTGVDTIYYGGDDGYYKKGWWLGRTLANNRVRFVTATISDELIVLDRATKLIWAGNYYQPGCNSGNPLAWEAAINYSGSLNFAGRTGWRIPNIKELFSLVDNSVANPTIAEPPFQLTPNQEFWSTTTDVLEILNAWRVHFSTGGIYAAAKTMTYNIRVVQDAFTY